MDEHTAAWYAARTRGQLQAYHNRDTGNWFLINP